MHVWLFHTSDGKPYIGKFADDGRTRIYIREVTEDDRKALYSGYLNSRGEQVRYDQETDPVARAWADHVRNGGD